jgi:uncharacterized protein
MALRQPDDDANLAASPAPKRRGRTSILVYRALGTIMVAIATAGVFLPLLPTTVFLLAALFFFARGSPELADKLRAHKRFGPILVRWEEKRAIPTGAKAMAVGMMGASWTGLALTAQNAWLVGGVGALLLAVAGYVVTRPSA